MQTLKIALTIIVALLLQMVLPKHVGFFRYLDLPLVITVYFSLQRAPVLGMAVGVLAGIGGDIIGSGILGVRGFAKTLVAYLVAVASIKLSLENPLARLAVVAIASAANIVFFIGLNLMLEQSLPLIGTWGDFGRTLGRSVLGDTLVSLVIFFLLDRIFPEQPAARRMAIKKRFYE